MEGIIKKNLLETQIDIYPFNHRKYTLFNENLCKKLIDNFNLIKKSMSQYDGISKSRFMICLSGDTKEGIKYDKYSFLETIEPLNSVLQEYVNLILPSIYNKYFHENSQFRFQINLVFDTKNYQIGPHTDSYNRKLTNIVYLVNDNDIGKKLGVSLYKDLINRHKNKWEKTHYSFDNFEKISNVEYYSGSSIDFQVSNNSFHGVDNINEDCERMSIQSMIWK